MRNLMKAMLMLGLGVCVATAEDVNETVKKLGAAAGKAYMAPVVSGLGSNLNAGWFHRSPPAKKLGFNFEVGAVAMGTLLKGGSKTLSTSGPMKLDSATTNRLTEGVSPTGGARDSVRNRLYGEEVEVGFFGPTVIGSDKDTLKLYLMGQDFILGNGDTVTVNDTVTIEGVTGKLGDYVDYPLPLVAPQISIGTIYGTNLTIRYLPEYEATDLGKIKFSGFGIQHNPAVWLSNPLPIDLSVGYYMQTLELGSLFKASSQAYGVNASKTFGWRRLNLTPYGGFMLESSKFDFEYDMDINGTPETIKFTLEGENNYRATVGLSVRLLVLNLNADYNFGKYQSLSAGVMVGI